METNCLVCDYKNLILEQLPEDEIELINKTKTALSYSNNELLFKEGQTADNLICVRHGFVKLYREINKKQKLVAVTRSGQFVSPVSVILHPTYKYSAYCVGSTEVCSIKKRTIQNLLNENNAFSTNFMTTVFKYIDAEHQAIFQMRFKQVKGKVAFCILNLKNLFFDSASNMVITRQDFADFLGISVENLSRVLHEFSESNIIELDNHYVKVLKFKNL
jgi:CRP/FNR family transcriptional regulator